MGGSQSKSPPQSFWEYIKTAWGCPNWFSITNIPTCFSALSIVEKAEFLFLILYVGGALITVVLILGDLLVGGEGFVEDLSSIFGDLSGIFEWLSSFLESAFEYIVFGAAYIINEIMDLANYMGQATGTPALVWIFIAGMAMIWAAVYVIKDVLEEAQSFKDSAAWPFFYVMNTPIRWIVEGLQSVLGQWAATIAQVIAFPINCVIFLLSEILGWIWLALKAFF